MLSFEKGRKFIVRNFWSKLLDKKDFGTRLSMDFVRSLWFVSKDEEKEFSGPYLGWMKEFEATFSEFRVDVPDKKKKRKRDVEVLEIIPNKKAKVNDDDIDAESMKRHLQFLINSTTETKTHEYINRVKLYAESLFEG